MYLRAAASSAGLNPLLIKVSIRSYNSANSRFKLVYGLNPLLIKVSIRSRDTKAFPMSEQVSILY